jgi:hypothetical protein
MFKHVKHAARKIFVINKYKILIFGFRVFALCTKWIFRRRFETLRLVAQCLNHYSTPGPRKKYVCVSILGDVEKKAISYTCTETNTASSVVQTVS